MNGIAILVALVAVLAALGFFLSGRAARAAARAGARELEALRNEGEAWRKEAASLKAEAKERREEAVGLRAKLEETKRRAFDHLEAQKRLGGAAALREEIDKLSARLADARAEAGHAAERTRSLEAQLEKASRELEKAREARPAPRSEPAAPAAPPPPAASAEAEKLAGEKLAAEKERADRTEAKLTEARKRLAEVEKDLKSARGRLETEKRLYVVQKGELDLAADRYAELKRRHDGLRKDHEELLEAVRQAAREDRRLAEAEASKTAPEGSNVQTT